MSGDMEFDQFKQELETLGISNGVFRPHKPLAFLAAIRLLNQDGFAHECVPFDENFVGRFTQLFNEYASQTASSCRAHTPFFHLRTSSFWDLVAVPGQEQKLLNTPSVGGPGAVRELVKHAVISESCLKYLRDAVKRNEVEAILVHSLVDGCAQKSTETRAFERVSVIPDASSQNPFVGYLNSLQRSGGSNENSLAESQACNAQFASIHVSHPLAEMVLNELTGDAGHHVILTGHAGDGKSTLALEVFKRLSGLDDGEPLASPLKPREDVESVSIIKDLSERAKKDDASLLQELSHGERRFLIVSNTGTLLDLVKGNTATFGSDALTLETEVLEAIGADTGESMLSFGELHFRVYNLALIDNLGMARGIFERMIAPEHWSACSERDCAKTCPIYMNVDLMQRNQPLILERIFLAYRRMYEYGTRLTMRQFTEHLSYMITAGLQDNDIRILQKRRPIPLRSEFLFFNRFFGDNGHAQDDSATQMKAIREIKNQGFGDRPLPGWEHRLWLRNCGTPVSLGIDTLDDEFEKLRRHGAHAERLEGMTRNEAREQVRRMLFFLHVFPEESRGYLGQYLNSPALLSWRSWQQPHATLSFNDRTSFDQKIYHVLQEHFTGVRLPEGSTQNDRRLYVTLSRRRSEVRQSAQVVLAQIDWESSVQLELSEIKSATGDRRQDLVLRGTGGIAGINLPLGVPFLDYVMMRHFGELGEVLDASYRERLDRFKAQVHSLASEADKGGMMLVRLRTDHTFRRQYFSVGENGLEVRDA